MLLRINSILRRAPKVNPVEPSVLSLGAFVYHPERNELLHNGQPVRLSHAEGQILRVFAERPGDIVSRDELARRTGAEANPRTVDVQITRLRKKIEADPRQPRYLQTIRGKGYRMRTD